MKLSELFMKRTVPGLGVVNCPDEVEAREGNQSWEPCPFCGAPMTDDDGASWPYCVNPSCTGEDAEYPW